jgi:hypothetical protein
MNMVSQIAKCWRTFAKCWRTFAKCSRTFGSIVFKCSRVFAFFKNSRTFEMFASVCRIYEGSTTVLFLHDFIHTPFLRDSLVCFWKLGSTRSRTFEIALVRFWAKSGTPKFPAKAREHLQTKTREHLPNVRQHLVSSGTPYSLCFSSNALLLNMTAARHRNIVAATAVLLVFFLLSAAVVVVSAGNPFSSNVIPLTAKNFRTEVEESEHAVFINICRSG